MIMSALQKLLSVGDGQGKVNGGGFDHLSDDLVVEMLRRLPATSCGCLVEYSTKWRRLCTLPYGVQPGSSPVYTASSKVFMPNNEIHHRLHLLEMDGRLTCWYLSGQDVCAWAADVCGSGDDYTAVVCWHRIYHLDFNPRFESYFSGSVPDNYHVKLVSIQDGKITSLATKGSVSLQFIDEYSGEG
ncbi:hypothetical protein F3Y22_tig00111671pilonHSYRG00186 [Hibiscus syriacus]|uniref:F-box domain-containing protein n=1 Tax=Hibiscus syriacus TaxID=106335 RepID=A0A6A2XI08_HIBSY|nr:hypothetical protein F3Y22_tig00111671pilonHSYRG00186 [Hibiscus syriacus]